jgi:hypothetical protein
LQICQQTSSTMHSECFAGTAGERLSSQILLAAHLSVMYPRRVQIWWAKGQSSSRCVQVSGAILQSSQTGSSTTPFLWRLSRHCSLSCTSSQPKNWGLFSSSRVKANFFCVYSVFVFTHLNGSAHFFWHLDPVNVKFFCDGILTIWSTKWSLFTKLFAQMDCKSRDESNDAN